MHSEGAPPCPLLLKWVMILPSHHLSLTQLTQINPACYSSSNWDVTLVTPSPSITSCVKLPKLTNKKFNGDLTKWVTLWDFFDSPIHSNLDVDKFNYLNTFLELTDGECIAGLTSANYRETVATLKRRFGNTQFTMGTQKDALLNLPQFSSSPQRTTTPLWLSGSACERAPSTWSDSRLLWQLADLGCYQQLALWWIISQELTEEKWKLMKIVDQKVDVREWLPTSSNFNHHSLPLQRVPPTAAALMTSNFGPVHCAFCKQGHVSSSCTVVNAKR